MKENWGRWRNEGLGRKDRSGTWGAQEKGKEGRGYQKMWLVFYGGLGGGMHACAAPPTIAATKSPSAPPAAGQPAGQPAGSRPQGLLLAGQCQEPYLQALKPNIIFLINPPQTQRLSCSALFPPFLFNPPTTLSTHFNPQHPSIPIITQ
jgi:hypothetical protein